MIIVEDRKTGTVTERRGRVNLYLTGKDRLYTFEFGRGYVGVRKFLGDRCIEDRTLATPQARSLWAWLVKIGYMRV